MIRLAAAVLCAVLLPVAAEATMTVRLTNTTNAVIHYETGIPSGQIQPGETVSLLPGESQVSVTLMRDAVMFCLGTARMTVGAGGVAQCTGAVQPSAASPYACRQEAQNSQSLSCTVTFTVSAK